LDSIINALKIPPGYTMRVPCARSLKFWKAATLSLSGSTRGILKLQWNIARIPAGTTISRVPRFIVEISTW